MTSTRTQASAQDIEIMVKAVGCSEGVAEAHIIGFEGDVFAAIADYRVCKQMGLI